MLRQIPSIFIAGCNRVDRGGAQGAVVEPRRHRASPRSQPVVAAKCASHPLTGRSSSMWRRARTPRFERAAQNGQKVEAVMKA